MFKNEQINLEELPTVDAVSYKSISKTYLKVLLANRIIVFSIMLIALFLVKAYTNNMNFERSFSVFVIALLVVFVLNIVLVILSFSKRQYALRTHDIIYTKGLLVNTVTTLPFIRIQHIEISRSFLARKLNLATLNIYSAGSSGENLSIKGLPLEDANRLNDHITSKLNE